MLDYPTPEFTKQILALQAQIEYWKSQALIDPLTSLRNRRALDLDSKVWSSESDRGSNLATSIVVIDVNDFKKLNDTLGHDAGDVALTQISKCIIYNISAADLAYRLGGDEFLVALRRPGLSEVVTDRVISRICETVRLAGYSVSCGGAALSGSLDEAIKIADQRMYDHKLKIKSGDKQ